MLNNFFTLFSLVIIVQGQLKSPCPDIFSYDEPSTNMFDRTWWGLIKFNTTKEMGVVLKILLDRKVKSLGSWFGQSVPLYDTEYSVKIYKEYISGYQVQIKFYVTFESYDNVPSVKIITLNGKKICPASPIGSAESELPPTTDYNGEEIGTDDRSPTVSDATKNDQFFIDGSLLPPFEKSTSRPLTMVRQPVSSTTVSDATENDRFYSGGSLLPPSEKSTSRPLTVARQPVQCGIVAQRVNPLINYGESTMPGQWPWHVALYHSKGLDLIYTCGGTLISEQFIVTAAHCVTKQRSSSHVDKKFLVAHLGKYGRTDVTNDVQSRQVDRIIVHPEYNYTVYYNDIALLKLDIEAELNNFVRPCCLWEEENDNIETLAGVYGTVVGWGFDENKQLSKTLMQTQMPILSTRTCLFSNRNFFSQFIFDKNFCAGFTNGTSVCNGDSGGGMVIQKYSPRGLNTLWQLRGIVSVGVSQEGTCDPNQYAIFTDAGQYVSWIRQITQQA